jgi:hypothetical protein
VERFEVPASMCPRISEQFREVDDAVFTWDMVYGAVDEDVEPLVFAEEAW